MDQDTDEAAVAALMRDEGQDVVRVHLSRGDGDPTREQILDEVRSALRQEREGTAIVSTEFPDDRPTIDVPRYLAGL